LLGAIILLTVPLLILGIFAYNESKNSLDESGAKRLEYSVQMTIEMIDVLQEEVEKGNITLEDAQEKVKDMLLGPKDADGRRPIKNNLDLGENGYPFVISQEGVLLADPDAEGMNVWDVEDENGVKFAQEQIKVAKEGGGLYYYEWYLPNSETLAEKV